ncbi:MAG: type II toxin-antitoxin system Phd/YefM family antitoxin [Thiomargarita sp.]|jgi:antitoxin YefM|nr:type II toxin-antitoxin system Phd/YefM family antitoxin [Thiomargarita sp.]
MIYDSTNLTQASVNLAKLCDQVVDDRDVVIINRPDSENVALIAADELESLMETAIEFAKKCDSSANGITRI